jgi:hypothetical protein
MRRPVTTEPRAILKYDVKRLLIVVVLIGCFVTPASPDWTEPDPEFVFARLQVSNRDPFVYWPNYWPFNPPWRHDYPSSDEFIIGLIHELTGLRVSANSYKIVRLDSDDVFKYPFLYLSEPGFLDLTDKEIHNLGEYIRRGGFIVADDFRTQEYLHNWDELEVLRDHLKRALPERNLVRLDLSHPVFHTFFDVDTLDMKAPYGDFKPEFWGLSDEKGRLQVLAFYNNDIGDFWKYLDEGDAPLQDSSRSIRIGIDAILYAITH